MSLNRQIYDVLSFTPKRLVAPDSWVKHIHFAYFAVSILRPALIVELGVHSGNSFSAFCQAVAENDLPTKCYGIDTFAGDAHSRLYDESIFQDIASFVEENFGKFASLIRSSFAESVNLFKDKSIDLLHIDGLHTYAAVSRDFATWLPKVRENGVILFHDIQVKGEDFGVWRLWAEIKEKYKITYEFHYGYGLGVLCLGENRLARSLSELSANFDLEKCFYPGWSKLQTEFDKEQLVIQNRDLQDQLTKTQAETARINTLLGQCHNEVLQAQDELQAIHVESKKNCQRAEKLKLKCEREKQDLWEGRLWLEQQYDNLQQSKTYRLGYHLTNCLKLREPFYNLSRLSALAIPLKYKTYFRNPSLLVKKLRLVTSSLQNLILAHTVSSKKSIKPLEIQQQPWSGPLVSVIVTCYNYGSFLNSVLGCLEAQTCHDFEIILIDDGSTDPETVARIEDLKKLHRANLTVIQQPNQGVIAARNNAIAKAKGKYIFPLDADDTIEQTFLEKCLLFLENSPEHFFVYSWTHSIGDKDFIWETLDSDPDYSLVENRMGYALFRKSAFIQVGGYNPVMAGGYEDWEFCVNLVAHGYIGRVIKEPLYNYYVKPGARNFHAIKKHESLRDKIIGLHRPAIKTHRRHLLQLAQQSYLVQNQLVNFSEKSEGERGKELFLIDLYNSEIDISVVREKLISWLEKSTATFLLTLKTPWVDLFPEDCPENLYIYYPEHYHPDGDAKPFYEYLEFYYHPQRKNIDELN